MRAGKRHKCHRLRSLSWRRRYKMRRLQRRVKNGSRIKDLRESVKFVFFVERHAPGPAMLSERRLNSTGGGSLSPECNRCPPPPPPPPPATRRRPRTVTLAHSVSLSSHLAAPTVRQPPVSFKSNWQWVLAAWWHR